MSILNIARTLSVKRREKGITQDELAEYIGVSKSSVSKWETGQSYPDITFLPQLASYFNISVDDLIGYEPQMEKEQIVKLYRRLSTDFLHKDALTVYNECKEIEHKYYSCYPLLLQLAKLYLNQFLYTEMPDLSKAMLQSALELYRKVKTECGDILMSQEALLGEANILLLQQKPQEMLALYGEEPLTLLPVAEITAQAYMMLGKAESADEILQISVYQHMIYLFASSAQMLSLEQSDPKKAQEIIRRILGTAELFCLDTLHPHTAFQIYLLIAQYYCTAGDIPRALEFLGRYTALFQNITEYVLHGDDYFDHIHSWLDSLSLGNSAPLETEMIRKNIVRAVVENPVFKKLADEPQFILLCQKLHSVHGGED